MIHYSKYNGNHALLMKQSIPHEINSRVFNTFAPINIELQLDNQKNYLFDLPYLSVLAVDGEKSLEFLQGQLTCDMRLMNDIQMLRGAQCNLKGRILSLLDILQWQGIKLVLPLDLLESTQNSLAKTAELSRVAIKHHNELAVFGFYLQNPNDPLIADLFLPKEIGALTYNEQFCYYHLGKGFYVFLVNAARVLTFCQPFIEKDQLLGSLTWHTLRLYEKQIEIYPKSRGLFLPHRLDLHLTPYISFDKGCYKGQEIIARTHYKATLKHELKLFELYSLEILYSGQKLYAVATDQEVGELVDYSVIDQGRFIVAVSMLKNADLNVRLEGQSTVVNLIDSAGI